ncbi:MAG TPA: hypothetical protein VFC44_27480 [Candidatus Saccharimonadales bacterium]|nr:hypothetical protein [Candidatus Saccharimonadales bacterium]
MLVQDHRPSGPGALSGFSIAFTGIFIGIVPLLALDLLRYSQQWQAGDLFRVAPMKGPGALCDGARRAVLLILTLPVLGLLVVLTRLLGSGNLHLPLLLPGIIALPVYAMLACVGGDALPLSLPTEEAKSAGRGVKMIMVMMVSALLAMVAALAWNQNWFGWMLLIEAISATGLYLSLRAKVRAVCWTSLE